MIDEVMRFLKRYYPKVKRVGVLSTTGTYHTQVYPSILEPAGFEVLVPDIEVQEQQVNQAIYDLEYGIKACGMGTQQSREKLWAGARNLRKHGAEAVILGCTEIPLAIPEQKIEEMTVIDPTLIMARALIREVNPAKLKPYGNVRGSD